MENNSINEQAPNPFLRETFAVGKNDYLLNFYSMYSKKDRSVRIMLSMINSILHHRLTFFMIEPFMVNQIYENDKNFICGEIDTDIEDRLEVEQRHELFKLYIPGIDIFRFCDRAIRIMKRKKVIREVRSLGAGNIESTSPAVYEVIDKDLLNEIGATDVEREANRQMVIDYLIKL